MSLRQRFLAPENFELAWDKVASNRGCAGVDRETISDFGHRKHHALPHLRRLVANGTYRPLPMRQLFIPKPKGGWRELNIPSVRDRIVQQALLQVLHPVMEPQFEPASFAYRPGRSHLMAVRQVAQWRDRGYDWVRNEERKTEDGGRKGEIGFPFSVFDFPFSKIWAQSSRPCWRMCIWMILMKPWLTKGGGW